MLKYPALSTEEFERPQTGCMWLRGPVRAEEGVLEDKGAEFCLLGTSCFKDDLHKVTSVVGHQDLVQVQKGEVACPVEVAIETVLQCRQLAMVVDVLRVQPPASHQRPLDYFRYALWFVLSQIVRYVITSTKIIKHETSCTKHPINFYHLHQSIDIVELIKQRGDTDGQVGTMATDLTLSCSWVSFQSRCKYGQGDLGCGTVVGGQCDSVGQQRGPQYTHV